MDEQRLLATWGGREGASKGKRVWPFCDLPQSTRQKDGEGQQRLRPNLTHNIYALSLVWIFSETHAFTSTVSLDLTIGAGDQFPLFCVRCCGHGSFEHYKLTTHSLHVCVCVCPWDANLANLTLCWPCSLLWPAWMKTTTHLCGIWSFLRASAWIKDVS